MKDLIIKLKKNFKEDILAYHLLFLGFLLRLFYIFSFTIPKNYLWSDAGTYDEHAMRMANGIHIALSTYWPPFFHIFLSWIYRPLIWLGLEQQRITIDIVLFSLFYIIGFWCIYQIAKKIFLSKKIADILLLALVLWYPFIYMNALIMSENLFFPLFFLGLYFLIIKPQTKFNGIIMGLLWGVAVITRPIFILAIPFFLIWGYKNKINFKFLFNFTVATGLIIASMMIFNFFYTGGREKSVSSSGGFNFAMTWCDTKSVKYTNADGYWYWFASAANIDYPDEKAISTTVPFENQGYYYQIGMDCIKKNPVIIIDNLFSIKKLFHSHLFPTTSDMTGWEFFRFIFKVIVIGLFALSIYSFIGIKKGWIKIKNEIEKYLWLFALIILALFITIYLQNVGEERYIIPYSPLLMILAIPAINKISKHIFPIKFSKSKFIGNRNIWISYAVLFFIALITFAVYSIRIKTSYFINQDGTKTEISLPFSRDQETKNLSYEIIIISNISQNAKINIAFDDIMKKLSVNNKSLDLEKIKKNNNQKELADWKRGYIFEVPLKAGENKILISGENTGWGHSLKIKQKPFLWIWMLLFISIALPASHITAVLIELIFKNKK